MRVTLLVPDLIWSRVDQTSVFDRLDQIPGSDILLKRLPTRAPLETIDQTIATLAGGRLSPAELRLAGEETPRPGIDSRRLLCADPVHFRFHQEFLLVADESQIGLEDGETESLLATLNEQLRDRGRFWAEANSRWYLELADPVAHGWPALTEIVGRSLSPRLFAPAELQRLGSEAQMILHAHPVNQKRESEGKPLVNGIWLWGSHETTSTGARPIEPGVPGPRSGPPLLVGNAQILRGAARHIGADYSTLDAIPSAAELLDAVRRAGAKSDSAVVLLDDFRSPAAYDDADAYQQAFGRLVRDWLAPLHQAWRSGVLEQWSVEAPVNPFGSLHWSWAERPGWLDNALSRFRSNRHRTGFARLATELGDHQSASRES